MVLIGLHVSQDAPGRCDRVQVAMPRCPHAAPHRCREYALKMTLSHERRRVGLKWPSPRAEHVHAGTNAWILSGTKGPTQALRMKASRRHPLSLGGVDCRLLHYEVRPPPPAGDAAPTSRPGRQPARPAAGTF